MTEQTEWRSGDVVVTDHVTLPIWWAVVPGHKGKRAISKELFPDPQALADFIDCQRPKPRYTADGLEIYCADGSYVATACGDLYAERIARLLNADEAE